MKCCFLIWGGMTDNVWLNQDCQMFQLFNADVLRLTSYQYKLSKMHCLLFKYFLRLFSHQEPLSIAFFPLLPQPFIISALIFLQNQFLFMCTTFFPLPCWCLFLCAKILLTRPWKTIAWRCKYHWGMMDNPWLFLKTNVAML